MKMETKLSYETLTGLQTDCPTLYPIAQVGKKFSALNGTGERLYFQNSGPFHLNLQHTAHMSTADRV
jgi:hypothetical protein